MITVTLSLPVRILTGLALVMVAVLHLKIAGNYVDLGTKPFSIGYQFYAQAAGAFLLTVALAVKPHRLVWLAVLGFGLLSFGALVYSRYKGLPVPGLPGGFQESWDVPQAKNVAYAEVAAIVLALVGLVLSSGRVAGSRRP